MHYRHKRIVFVSLAESESIQLTAVELSDPPMSGDAADSDRDGLSNRTEYAP